jgi:competence protein ComEC
MSFAATTALVAVFSEIRDRQLWVAWPKWAGNVSSLVISSAIAGLATAPFGAFHFNQMSQWGLVANLASVPVMGMVVMPGAVLAALLSPLGLEQLGLEISRLGIRWILFVAETVASWDSALRLIPQPGRFVLPLLGLGGAALCLMRSYRRLAGVALLAVAMGLWSISTRPDVLISDTGTLIGVMGPEGRQLNKPKGDGFVAGAWLENDGDAATQEEAALRATLTRNEAKITLDGQVVHYLRANDLSKVELSRLCTDADLLILPSTKDRPDCAALTEADLRRSGSVSVSTSPDGLRLQTSKQIRGDRLWVR